MFKSAFFASGAALFLFGGPAAAQEAVRDGARPEPMIERDVAGEIRDSVDEVVVTGTRTARLHREAPVRTDVIGEQILRLAAPKNLADALEYLPGARAESNCQNCNTTEIQLLGLPGTYNHILFDGLPLLSGVAAVYGVEQIPTILIERIEVVKGGASALYGPGAVAGVVNIIPRRIGDTRVRATATYERPKGENYGAISIAATYAPGEGGSGLQLFAHAEDAPAVDYDGDGYTELATRELAVAGARGRLELGPRTALLAEHQFISEDRRGGNRLDHPSFLANISEEIDTRLHRTSLSVEHEFSDNLLVVGTYAGAFTGRDSFYGGLGEVETDPSAPGFDVDALAEAVAVSRNQYGTTDNVLHFAEARFEAGLGRHAVIGGVQYRYESVEDLNIDVDGRELAVLNDDDFDNLGVFLQDELTLRDNLRLVLGGRVDFSSELDEPAFSPRVALWYSPSDALVLRANLSTGFRAPEVFSEDLHVDTLGGTPIREGNAPGLVEESSTSLAIGFDWRPAFDDGALTLDAQAYYTKLEDTFFLGDLQEAADGTLFRLRTNAGGSTISGAEATATYRVSERLRGSLGAAYIRAEYDDPQLVFEDGETRLFTERYLKSPELTAVAQAVWEPLDDIQAFLALRYIGGMDVLNNRTGSINGTEDFLVADVSLTRHVDVGRDVDVTVGVKNLTDDRQDDLEVGAARDSDCVYGPRAPRTFFIRLDAAF